MVYPPRKAPTGFLAGKVGSAFFIKGVLEKPLRADATAGWVVKSRSPGYTRRRLTDIAQMSLIREQNRGRWRTRRELDGSSGMTLVSVDGKSWARAANQEAALYNTRGLWPHYKVLELDNKGLRINVRGLL